MKHILRHNYGFSLDVFPLHKRKTRADFVFGSTAKMKIQGISGPAGKNKKETEKRDHQAYVQL